MTSHEALVSRQTGLCKVWSLTPQLQAVVGVPNASRIQVQQLLIGYIKCQKLQDKRDRRFFYPDYKLNKLFGPGKKKMIHLSRYLRPHLRPFN